MTSLKRPFRILPLVALSLVWACGGDAPSTSDGSGDVPSGPAAGVELEVDDYVGIEAENVSFNLNWANGPVNREPSRLAPPVNDLQAVTTVEGEGFDRVIFHFGQDGQVPGYELAWVEGEPVDCDGAAVSGIDGERHLLVRLRSVGAEDDVLRPVDAGFDNLKALASTCRQGNESVWHFGVERAAQVRVFEMHSPRRLVVDVSHEEMHAGH